LQIQHRWVDVMLSAYPSGLLNGSLPASFHDYHSALRQFDFLLHDLSHLSAKGSGVVGQDIVEQASRSTSFSLLV
jgi:hypothetical protein